MMGMSTAFWVVTFPATAITAYLVNRWADTWVDGAIILTTYIWTEFALIGIDLYRQRLMRKS